MGLVQTIRDYFDGQKEKKAQKCAKLVKNPKAIREDRWAALEYLAHIDDPENAIPALLDRFEYSLEHGINDTREKELAMKGIVKYKATAIPYVKEKICKSTRIAWPMKIIQSVSDEPTVVETLKSALNFEDVSFDQSAVDKNYDILCYLRDYQLGQFVPKLSRFVTDLDERVRFACAEVLIEQDNNEVPNMLEHLLSDNTEENRRIKQTVLRAFLEKKWKVKDASVFAEGKVADSIYINKANVLEQRASV
ncbi:MAG: hypothetical protein AB7T49_03195 [Oligoflexales bacterium]